MTPRHITDDPFVWVDRRIWLDMDYTLCSEHAKLALVWLGLLAPAGSGPTTRRALECGTGMQGRKLSAALLELEARGWLVFTGKDEVCLATGKCDWARPVPRKSQSAEPKRVRRRGRWMHLPPDRLGNDAPDVPGVYCFILDGHVGYIGQSQSLKSRLASYSIRSGYGSGYHTPWGFFSSVLVKVRACSATGEWLMREMRLIQRLQPIYNTTFTAKKGRRRSEARV